ncbi:MAG: hypothetical protein FWD27_00560 [Coriobacteriia bacterium]|nr:hypothetical protein [Coriobacteriia bacterium]
MSITKELRNYAMSINSPAFRKTISTTADQIDEAHQKVLDAQWSKALESLRGTFAESHIELPKDANDNHIKAGDRIKTGDFSYTANFVGRDAAGNGIVVETERMTWMPSFSVTLDKHDSQEAIDADAELDWVDYLEKHNLEDVPSGCVKVQMLHLLRRQRELLEGAYVDY